VLIAVLWVGLPLAIIELGFRAWEQRYLIEERRIAPGEEVYALDDHGYAEDPVAARADPDELRILSLGDSFAHSIVETPYTYARMLEHELGARVAHGVRVVNLGRGGTSFPGYLHELETWRTRIDYDAVLVNVYAGNDFADAGTELTSDAFASGAALAPPTREPDGAATIRTGIGTTIPRRHALRIADWLHAAYLRSTLEETSLPRGYRPGTLQMSEGRYLRVQGNVIRPYLPGTLEREPEGLVSLAGLLERLRDLEAEGRRTLVFVSPPEALVSAPLRERVLAQRGIDADAIDPGLPASAVRAVAELVGYGGPVVDLGACLAAAERPDAPLYLARNTHWSLEGNRVVARILAATLARAWLPELTSERAGDCLATPAPAPSAALRTAAEHALERARMRAPLLAPLESDTPRSRPQVEAALEAAGRVRADPVDVSIDGLLVRDAFLQLAGSFESAGEVRASVVVLLFDGRPLAAAALRAGRAPEHRSRFSLRPSLRCAERRPEQAIDLLVLTPDAYRWGRPSRPIGCGPGLVAAQEAEAGDP
jgi:hypothetical protein